MWHYSEQLMWQNKLYREKSSNHIHGSIYNLSWSCKVFGNGIGLFIEQRSFLLFVCCETCYFWLSNFPETSYYLWNSTIGIKIKP